MYNIMPYYMVIFTTPITTTIKKSKWSMLTFYIHQKHPNLPKDMWHKNRNFRLNVVNSICRRVPASIGTANSLTTVRSGALATLAQ